MKLRNCIDDVIWDHILSEDRLKSIGKKHPSPKVLLNCLFRRKENVKGVQCVYICVSICVVPPSSLSPLSPLSPLLVSLLSEKKDL